MILTEKEVNSHRKKQALMEQGDYSIPLRNLPNGDHDFSFDCGSDLFGRVENALVEKGKIHAAVHTHKNDQMMVLDFDISGTVDVECCVCLDHFDYPIEDCRGRITVKFGDHYEEINDELYVVDEIEETLDLSQWIYELVCVSIPISCEHPLDNEGYSMCNPAMLDELDKYSAENQTEPEADGGDAAIDPRWAVLKGLINKE